jgi:hypothetical protein
LSEHPLNPEKVQAANLCRDYLNHLRLTPMIFIQIEQGQHRDHSAAARALPDLTRCDCLTDTHAVEVEFGRKWAEGIGQALYYALQTGHKAGIILILESEKDYKYWLRLNTTIEHHGLEIDTWKIGPVEGILLKRHND